MKNFLVIVIVHVVNAGLLENFLIPSSSFSSSSLDASSNSGLQKFSTPVVEVSQSFDSLISSSINEVIGNAATLPVSSNIVNEHLSGNGKTATEDSHHELETPSVGHIKNFRTAGVIEEPLEKPKEIKTIRKLERQRPVEDYYQEELKVANSPTVYADDNIETLKILEEPSIEYVRGGYEKIYRVFEDSLTVEEPILIQFIEQPVQGSYQKRIRNIQVIEQPLFGHKKEKLIRVVCDGQNYSSFDFEQIIKLLADNEYFKKI